MPLQNIDSHISFNLGKANLSAAANNLAGNDSGIEEYDDDCHEYSS